MIDNSSRRLWIVGTIAFVAISAALSSLSQHFASLSTWMDSAVNLGTLLLLPAGIIGFLHLRREIREARAVPDYRVSVRDIRAHDHGALDLQLGVSCVPGRIVQLQIIVWNAGFSITPWFQVTFFAPPGLVFCTMHSNGEIPGNAVTKGYNREDPQGSPVLTYFSGGETVVFRDHPIVLGTLRYRLPEVMPLPNPVTFWAYTITDRTERSAFTLNVHLDAGPRAIGQE